MKLIFKGMSDGILRIKLIKFISIIVLFLSTSVHAQQDTLFWFAAPDISSADGDSPIGIRIMSYSSAANVTISQPANGGFTPISVSLAASSSQFVDLSAFLTDVEPSAANTVLTTGLKISSDEPISATYELVNATNKEVFSLKGNKALGTEFYTPFQKYWDNATISPATYSSIEVVATEDNTTVLITPRAAITGHAINTTFSVTLNEGETYSGRDTDVSATSSLSGSIVSADKPVAVTVFSGALESSTCHSTVGDQIVSRDYLGQDFIIHKATATDERVYVLATENSTELTITNSGTTTAYLSWGETYELALTDNINYISSNKNVYVFHLSGEGCSLGGAQVPHLSCAGKQFQAFSRTSSDQFGLVVFVRTGFEGDFQINGSTTLLQASDFSAVPGSGGDYMVAQKFFNTTDIAVDSYNYIENSSDIFGVGLINGVSASDFTYAYMSEFISYPTITAGTDATVCANGSINLNGFVSGGDVTATWGSNGYGSFENALTQLDNVYYPANLDTLISPIQLILTSTGSCPTVKDTLNLTVTAAPIVNASADQSVCANNAVVTLNGSVSGGSSTGLWHTLGSGSFTPSDTDLNAFYIPSAADTAAGLVELVLTSTSNGSCSAETDTMEISITEAPVVNSVDDTIYVCRNNANFSLQAQLGGSANSIKWITSGNGSFSPDNLSLNPTYQSSPQDITDGQITIYLESTSNGNCLKDADTVVVIYTDAPTVDAGVNLVACTNDAEVQLSGLISGPTTSGVWSGGAGTFSVDNTDLSATYTPTASEISSGTLTLVLTSTNNGSCSAVTDQMQLLFKAPPYANFSVVENCEADTTYFSDFSLNGAGTIVSWDWDFDDNSSTSTDQNPTYVYQTYGSYQVSLMVESSFGCTDTVVKTVNANEKPEADFTYDPSCENDQVIISFFDNSTVNSTTISSWYYDFGGDGAQAVQNPVQMFNGVGNYTITQIITTAEGCQDTIKKVIFVPDEPVAGFYYNTDNGANIGAEYTFIDTSANAVEWYWVFGNNSTSILQDPTTEYYANGTYTVTQYVTSSLGCMDSTSTIITINTVTTEINTLIPNAISPNGDGNNDVWKLEFIDYVNPEAQIIIFNRWGQTIFESIGYPEPWDGTYNGEDVPEGTYYYLIKISDTEVYEGTILVLKSASN